MVTYNFKGIKPPKKDVVRHFLAINQSVSQSINTETHTAIGLR